MTPPNKPFRLDADGCCVVDAKGLVVCTLVDDDGEETALGAYIVRACNRLAEAERLLRELYVLCKGHQELLGCDQLGGRAYSAAREFLEGGA